MSAERESGNGGSDFPSCPFFSEPSDPHTGAQLLVSRMGVADQLSASLVDSIFGSHLQFIQDNIWLPSFTTLSPTSLSFLVFPPLLLETLCMIWDFGDGLASTGDLTVEGHFPRHI